MAFQNYLLKVGDTDISQYVDIENYKVTPNQRADLDSGRNGLNILYREVANHYTTKIEFNTVPMAADEMTAFFQILSKAYINERERKVQVTYFDVNTGSYRMAEMYVPNFTIETRSWNGSLLIYKPMRIAFIEY